jgi:hypothetical protein
MAAPPSSRQADHDIEMSSNDQDGQPSGAGSPPVMVQEASHSSTNLSASAFAIPQQAFSTAKIAKPIPQAGTDEEILSGGVLIDYDYARIKGVPGQKTSVR